MVKMEKTSIDKILSITQGSLLKQGTNTRKVAGISTDTRQITPGSLFIALVGEKMDGHDFIADAVEKGATAVCVSDETKITQGDYTAILVNDTLEAYQAIAAHRRKEQEFTVVGVTGSVGKTSTRTMIAAALSKELSVHQTAANFNNDVGLPKTLLETPAGTDVCIVEMAMRGLGEIRRLTQIAKPDIAVITNIGFSHMERLGSQNQIFKAKIEIVEGLHKDGLLILNANDPFLTSYAEKISWHIRTAAVMVGEKVPVEAEFIVRGYDLRQTAENVTFDVEIGSFQGVPVTLKDVVIPVPGTHNVMNALIGIAVAVEMDLNLQNVISGLSCYQAVGNRQRILRHRDMTIIDDTYNAGPESMRAAIAMLSDIAGEKRRIAVLGGMLELGKHTANAHENIGKACVEYRIDKVFLLGEYAADVRKGIEKALEEEEITRSVQESPDCTSAFSLQPLLYDTQEELITALLHEVKKNDVILVKGSRMYEMEKVVQALIKDPPKE
jgi:UDP-N-acetylmuramoyl-tripeptide--D-alanyl-D-alanine ligase